MEAARKLRIPPTRLWTQAHPKGSQTQMVPVPHGCILLDDTECPQQQ